MKRNNKTWIQQLSESYIRQALNEMAFTPQGAIDARKKQGNFENLGMSSAAEADMQTYRELLRTHPTKIFNGSGEHVGNIVHQALPGHDVPGHDPHVIAAHDRALHWAAYTANEHLKGQGVDPAHGPHPDHVALGNPKILRADLEQLSPEDRAAQEAHRRKIQDKISQGAYRREPGNVIDLYQGSSFTP